MKVLNTVKSWFVGIKRKNYKDRTAKYSDLDQLWLRADSDKNHFSEKIKKLTASIAGLKTTIKNIKESKDAHDRSDITRIDKNIDQLRTMFKEMSGSIDKNTKLFIERMGKIERNFAIFHKEVKKDIDALEVRVATAQKYEENTEKLCAMQEKINDRAEFYLAEIEKQGSAIRVIDSEFKSAMAIQCQDMIRRVNDQIGKTKANGQLHRHAE